MKIYLLIKYIKSVLWRVAKRLSYTEDARCLKVKPTTQLRHTVCMLRYPCKRETECTQLVVMSQNSWIVLASHSGPSLTLRVYPQWRSGGSLLHAASEVCSSCTFGTRERFMCLWFHIHKSVLLQISFEIVEGFSECLNEPDCSTRQVHIVVLPSDFVPKGNMVGVGTRDEKIDSMFLS